MAVPEKKDSFFDRQQEKFVLKWRVEPVEFQGLFVPLTRTESDISQPAVLSL